MDNCAQSRRCSRTVSRASLSSQPGCFTGFGAIPESTFDWFSLLQSRPLVGLSFLAAFDLVPLGLVFLALGAALWQHNKDLVLVAAASGLAGTSVSFSSNTSLSMLYLSGQYATQVRETHAGQPC